MEKKLALVNCLTLLQANSQLSNGDNHTNLITKVLDNVKIQETNNSSDPNAALLGVKNLIRDINNGELEFDLMSVKRRARMACAYDANLYKVIDEVITPLEDDEAANKKLYWNYYNELKNYLQKEQFQRAVTQASFSLRDAEESFDSVVSVLREQLEEVGKTASAGPAGLIGHASFNDENSMADIFTATQAQLDGNALKSGWKAVNRATGVHNGFVPGELWLMPALPHNGKTLFSLMLTTSLMIFNDASAYAEEGKQPMFLDISLENELTVNLPYVYKFIYEHFEKKPVNLKDVDPIEAEHYIKAKIKARGWIVEYERWNSSEFTAEAFADRCDYWVSKGRKIVCSRLDYLGVANKQGLGNGATGSEIREVYRRFRNVGSSHGMLMFSPHQLSPGAKQLRAMDPLRFIRELPGRGMYDGCTSVDNEADGELYFGITKQNGKSYFEVQRGKHRVMGGIETPDSHRYFVMPFAEVGTLPWDIDSDRDVSLKSINAAGMSNSGGDYL